jgi:hypothetical protein
MVVSLWVYGASIQAFVVRFQLFMFLIAKKHRLPSGRFCVQGEAARIFKEVWP